MEKVIATVVIIVLTLGLISYAVIGHMNSFKDTSDTVTTEQGKLKIVLENTDVVPGSTVKNYVRQSGLVGYGVYKDSKTDANKLNADNFAANVDESALYSVEKHYKSDTGSAIDYILVTAWTAA